MPRSCGSVFTVAGFRACLTRGADQRVGDDHDGAQGAVELVREDLHTLVGLLFRAGLSLDSYARAESAAGGSRAVEGLTALDEALLQVRSMAMLLPGLDRVAALPDPGAPTASRPGEDTDGAGAARADLEQHLALMFVSLADTLVTDFDVADVYSDLAEACTDLLGVSAAGLMLVDARGQLRVMACSSQRSRFLVLMDVQNDEGPSLDAHRYRSPVLVPDVSVKRDQWPRFADEALRMGYRATYAIPMRVRDLSIGALNLFDHDSHALDPAKIRVAQALADMATIAIIQHRGAHRHEDLSQRLHAALDSRAAIEQAKGIVAEHDQITMDAAFSLLRGYARHTNQRLSDLAGSLVRGELDSRKLHTAKYLLSPRGGI